MASMQSELTHQGANIEDAEEEGNIVCVDSDSNGDPIMFSKAGADEHTQLRIMEESKIEKPKPRIFLKQEEEEFGTGLGGMDDGAPQEQSEFNIGYEEKERKA